MSLVPPVSRDNFYYNGDLYVEVGNLNRHRRAAVSEITSFLRPDVKKALQSPPKDQVGHWYEAQLIHYGLPPSKDKARAKMRLLEALDYGRLAVPSNIVQMEAELKKEFSAAERKAKAELRASKSRGTRTEPGMEGRKRKGTENVGNAHAVKAVAKTSLGSKDKRLSSNLDAGSSRSPAKKAKTESSGSTQAIRSPMEHITPHGQKVYKRPVQTARSRKLTEAWLKDPTIGPGPIKPGELRYSLTPSGPFNMREEDLPLLHGVKKDSDLAPSSSIKYESDAERSHTPNFPSLGLINGIYELSCLTVEREWSCTDLTLILALDGTTVWGAYDLGMFSGILFLPQRPWQAADEPLPFEWRGREHGEGEMSFGDNCEGEISFLGNGKITGWISVYGCCSFEGERKPEAGTAVRPPRSMKAEWEGYNAQAYDEENMARWR